MEERTQKKENIIIYGAGYYGLKCIEHIRQKNNHNIVAIVDRAKSKIGTQISGIPVISLCEAKNINVEKVIIAISDYADVALELYPDYSNKLFVFSPIDDHYVALNEKYSEMVLRRFQFEHAVLQIQYGLLFECMDGGEFSDVKRVFVTDSQYIDIVRGFFGSFSSEIEVRELSDDDEIDNNDKILICSENYRELIGKIRERINNVEQYLVLPLCDVKNRVRLR